MLSFVFGVPAWATAALAGCMHSGIGFYLGHVGGRNMLRWAGASNAGLAITGLWWGRGEDYLPASLACLSCLSMGSVMWLHAARIAGTATAEQLFLTRVAAAGSTALGIDQGVLAFGNRPL